MVKDSVSKILESVSLWTTSGRQINPHNGGLAPIWIRELNIAKLLMPSLDFEPIKKACFIPAKELINLPL